ncbi:hypothetical protein GGS20DRAFT_543395 [Poronia punctata]|nr:hypothetical protein GGS20DRAFT_543395 [Poronia punctata]
MLFTAEFAKRPTSVRASDRSERTLQLQQESLGYFRSTPVAKRGAATGLTFRTISGVDAVIRHLGDTLLGDEDIYTWEHLIVPKKGYSHFSQPGEASGEDVTSGPQGRHEDNLSGGSLLRR